MAAGTKCLEYQAQQRACVAHALGARTTHTQHASLRMTSLGGPTRGPSAAAAAQFRRTASARRNSPAAAVPARAFNASPLPKLPLRDGGGATVTPEEAGPAFVPREA